MDRSEITLLEPQLASTIYVRSCMLYTDLETLAVVHTHHRATQSTTPLYVYLETIYSHESFYAEADRDVFKRTQADLLVYPMTEDDYQYIHQSRLYTNTHPRQRLCSFDDLENPNRPVPNSFWLNERYAVKILHSGLFTVRAAIIDLEQNRLYEDTLSHWLLRMEYTHDPNAETEFYIYALTDH